MDSVEVSGKECAEEFLMESSGATQPEVTSKQTTTKSEISRSKTSLVIPKETSTPVESLEEERVYKTQV